MLQKQKDLSGECRITTVLFDNKYELLHDRIDIKAVSHLKEEDYQLGGGTALLEAIGKTIHKIVSAEKHTAEEHRVGKVLFVIITEGRKIPAGNTLRKGLRHKLKRKRQNMAGNLFF